jgi:hypothetical protein
MTSSISVSLSGRPAAQGRLLAALHEHEVTAVCPDLEARAMELYRELVNEGLTAVDHLS